MAVYGSNMLSEVGLRLLFCPLGSNIILRTASCSVGVVLSVYSTFKALELRNQNEQQRWLLYWAAYESFTVAEVFTDKFLSWEACNLIVPLVGFYQGAKSLYICCYRIKLDSIKLWGFCIVRW